MEDEIRIVENFFPLYLQKKYKGIFFSEQITWNFNQYATSSNNDTSYNTNIKEDSSFVHIFEQSNKETSLFLEQVSKSIKEHFSVDVKEILRARLRFSMPNPLYEDNWYLPPHTDFMIPHHTLIYYINDNDAETLFFDQKHVPESKSNFDMKVIKKIKPKQGTAVLFNGLIFHAAKTSKLNPRMLLNINFL